MQWEAREGKRTGRGCRVTSTRYRPQQRKANGRPLALLAVQFVAAWWPSLRRPLRRSPTRLRGRRGVPSALRARPLRRSRALLRGRLLPSAPRARRPRVAVPGGRGLRRRVGRAAPCRSLRGCGCCLPAPAFLVLASLGLLRRPGFAAPRSPQAASGPSLRFLLRSARPACPAALRLPALRSSLRSGRRSGSLLARPPWLSAPSAAASGHRGGSRVAGLPARAVALRRSGPCRLRAHPARWAAAGAANLRVRPPSVSVLPSPGAVALPRRASLLRGLPAPRLARLGLARSLPLRICPRPFVPVQSIARARAMFHHAALGGASTSRRSRRRPGLPPSTARSHDAGTAQHGCGARRAFFRNPAWRLLATPLRPRYPEFATSAPSPESAHVAG